MRGLVLSTTVTLALHVPRFARASRATSTIWVCVCNGTVKPGCRNVYILCHRFDTASPTWYPHSPIRRSVPSTRLAHIDNQKENITNPTPAPPLRKLFHSSTTYVLGGSGMRAIEIECIRENTSRAVTRACHAVFLRVTWCVLNDMDRPGIKVLIHQVTQYKYGNSAIVFVVAPPTEEKH